MNDDMTKYRYQKLINNLKVANKEIDEITKQLDKLKVLINECYIEMNTTTYNESIDTITNNLNEIKNDIEKNNKYFETKV